MLPESPAELLAVLQNAGYMTNLNVAEQEALAEVLSLVMVDQGEWLFEQGDDGDSMYLLHKGVMQLLHESNSGGHVTLDVVDPGSFIGAMALLTSQPRSAGVKAVSDSALIKIPSEAIRALAPQHPAIHEGLMGLAEERFQDTQLAGVLSRYFGDLDAVALYDIRRKLQWRHMEGGEIVFNQGDHGDYMVIVINGRLRIIKEQVDGSKHLVGEVGRGQNVGEFAVLTQQPRTASVVAVRDSDLLILTADVFERLSEVYPHVLLRIARGIALQDQQQDKHMDRNDSAVSLAIVPVSDSAPLALFGEKLASVLQKEGHTIRFDAAMFDEQFGLAGAAQTPSGDPLNVALTAWLNQQELAYDFMIYQTDQNWSDWTRRAVRGADHIVLLADATAPPELSICEAAMMDLPVIPRIDLVLIQPDSIERPSGTARWLDLRPVNEHYHVRMGSEADFTRLGRFLTGQATGLVMGGGAARGYGHIGVDRALGEAGITIDMLGGTSMGALMAATIAMDWEYDEIMRRMSQYGSKEAILDFTYPATSLYESKKVTHMLEENFGGVNIEDLWRPFFAVSTNMSRSAPLIHRRGSFWEALRASLSIPGVFSPVSFEGDILIDGGVMNNVPIDLMRERVGTGTVIAVDVNPPQEKKREWDFAPSINGWQVMRSRVNPLAKPERVPTLAGTILRAFIINSNYRLDQTRHLADLFIQLNTGDYNMMDWSAYEELVEIGYQDGTKQLAAWKKSN